MFPVSSAVAYALSCYLHYWIHENRSHSAFMFLIILIHYWF